MRHLRLMVFRETAIGNRETAIGNRETAIGNRETANVKRESPMPGPHNQLQGSLLIVKRESPMPGPHNQLQGSLLIVKRESPILRPHTYIQHSEHLAAPTTSMLATLAQISDFRLSTSTKPADKKSEPPLELTFSLIMIH